MIHFSVDDTIDVFKYLTENKCSSVFQNPTLKAFKELNEKYGFKVSMYCFYETDGFNLSMCPDKYRDEFRQNANWLKFGFHALNEKTDYANGKAENFGEDLNKTLTALRNTVSEEAVTYNVRLGFGHGNIECIKKMKECCKQFNVLYGVDDTRKVYYLDENENKSYLEKGAFYDENLKITIKNCKKRLEENSSVKDDAESAEKSGISPFFTHECHLQKEKILNDIETLCKSGHKFII